MSIKRMIAFTNSTALTHNHRHLQCWTVSPTPHTMDYNIQRDVPITEFSVARMASLSACISGLVAVYYDIIPVVFY